MNDTPLTDPDLAAFLLAELPPDRADEVRARLATDPALRPRLERLRRLLDDLRDPDLAERWWGIDGSLRRSLVNVLPGAPAPAADPGLRERLAALVFDSLAGGGLTVGFRGGSGPRHLVYESGETEIDLEVRPVDDPRPGPAAALLRVTGQVSPPAAGATVTCRGGAARVTGTETDAEGLFSIDLEPGPWRIALEVADDRIVIDGLDLAPGEHAPE